MQPLVAGPRADLTEAEVLASLDPRAGMSLDWGVDVLDTDGVPTGETLPVDRDMGGAVHYSYRPPDRVTGAGTDVSETRRRADLTLVGDPSFNLLSRFYRVWLDLNGVRWWLGVFVSGLPGRSDDGVSVRQTLTLADKTWLWRQRIPPGPAVVFSGADVLSQITSDLADLGETPSFPGSGLLLDEDMFFDEATTYKTKWDRLLEAIGWDALTAREDGVATSLPLADIAGKGAETTYSPDGPGWTQVAAQVDPLLPELPNVVRFVARQGPSLPEEGNGWVTATNQSTGPASIDERGYEVLSIVDVEASTQTELDAIAATDAQRYFAGGGLVAQVKAATNPRMSDRDVVNLVKPRLGLSGDWLVTAWSLPLGRVTQEAAALMTVTAEARVVVS